MHKILQFVAALSFTNTSFSLITHSAFKRENENYILLLRFCYYTYTKLIFICLLLHAYFYLEDTLDSVNNENNNNIFLKVRVTDAKNAKFKTTYLTLPPLKKYQGSNLFVYSETKKKLKIERNSNEKVIKFCIEPCSVLLLFLLYCCATH